MSVSRRYILAAVVICATAGSASADPGKYLKKADTWFAGEEAKQIAANILSYQSELGGWPKNVSTTDAPFKGDRKSLQPTYDNGATTDELRFLARMYVATKDAAYKAAFDRGLDYVLKGQYANGGWQQYHPPPQSYHRHITFNDNAMVRLLEFVREVAKGDTYAFVEARRKDAATAFDRGVACILKCQIKVDGKLTAWCAQHDEVDL